MSPWLLKSRTKSHILNELINKGEFMSEKYKSGQIVKIKSGGPDMTIKEFSNYESEYICQWFAGKKLEQGYFPEDSLEPVPNNAGN